LKASTKDKICLMGANGAGKSSLLRLLRGELSPMSGEVRLNESVPTTYLPQGLKGFFSRPTLLDNFGDCECDASTVRRHLGAALIRRDKVHEPLDQFSNGELMRAAIVRAILTRSEFLILDEPTSHLDIESISVLEQLLGAFPGGFLLVSHDRTFVSNVADSLLMLDTGRLLPV
jgi:ATP-binding cassette subfamily F protein 3